jgi:hypothetical protein
MIRLAVTTLLVLSFSVILDSRGADATAISADVYLSQFCAGCALLTNDASKSDLDFLRSNETTPQDFTACRYHGKLYCKNLVTASWMKQKPKLQNPLVLSSHRKFQT